MKEKYEHYRGIMLEKVAELDDTSAEKYLTDPNSLTEAEISRALRKGTIDFKCHPLFCGRRTSTSACRRC
jgi:elongation factor G